jgi:pimeloyl-ACP methyl ester carboxylesterase
MNTHFFLVPKMDEFTIQIPGYSIAAKRWGDWKNPTVLALHGWLDNANSFDWLAEYLQKDYCVIAMDLPGHGLSSHAPEGGHYHFIDGVFTLVNVIKALKKKEVHLLGHSLGACLASIFAGVAPEYVTSLSLIEGLGPITSREEMAALQLSDYLKTQEAIAHKPQKGHTSIQNAVKARAQNGRVSLAIANQLCIRSIEERNNHYYWRHDRRLLSPSPLKMTEMQTLVTLQNIKAKTLLILANDGFKQDASMMQKRIDAVNELSLSYVDGGHHVHMEHPKEIAHLLQHFLVSV